MPGALSGLVLPPSSGLHEKDSPTKVEQGHRQPDPAHDTLKWETCSNAVP